MAEASSPLVSAPRRRDGRRVVTAQRRRSAASGASPATSSGRVSASPRRGPHDRRASGHVFAAEPASRSAALTVPLVVTPSSPARSTCSRRSRAGPPARLAAADRRSTPGAARGPDAGSGHRVQFSIARGRLGRRAARRRRLRGRGRRRDQDRPRGLRGPRGHLDRRRPGSAATLTCAATTDAARTVQRLVISHCRRGCATASRVLDPLRGRSSSATSASDRGAVRLQARCALLPVGHDPRPAHGAGDPAPAERFRLPGIYARNDIERGVHKAPANEVVQLAIDFEFRLNKASRTS